ncbi:MAG: MFS transporter [Ktedonobacteraceae bacterium]|nr:MFS transporter [Ktedonobacteraceae bacterium]MBO0791426.1 MFS transporter [Ktedonobacteraceae bacterium]
MAQQLAGNEVNVANRLDRLPISSVHRLVLIGLAFAYFFEFGDLNTFAYTAPALEGFGVDKVALITSLSFIGMFVGGVSGGWFADRVGRKRGLIYTVAGYSVFSLLNATAWDPISLGIFRFFTGIGLSAMTVIANTYISEFFPAAVRGRFQGWVMTIGLIGIPATSWVARLIIPLADWSWRLVFVWGALGILALFFVSKMVESPRWYEKHGKTREADEVMSHIEEVVSAERGPLAPAREASTQQVVRSVPYSELFRGVYLKRTLVLLIAWIFQTLGFYGFTSWVPTLLKQHGFSLVNTLTYSSAIAIGAPIGALIAAFVSDRMDRKWSLTITSVAIAIFGLLYGATFQPLLIVIFGFLVSVFIQTFAAFIYAYSPELYPTEARASGAGFTYGVGRLANAFGPPIVSFLFVGFGYGSVFIYIAACWIIVALGVGLFGPLTSRRSLEQITEQEEQENAVQAAFSQEPAQ